MEEAPDGWGTASDDQTGSSRTESSRTESSRTESSRTESSRNESRWSRGGQARGAPRRALVQAADDGAATGAGARGGQPAWDALVDRYSQDVWDTVRAYVSNGTEAANICALAWLRLADHIAELAEGTDVRAWVCDVAMWEALGVRASRQEALPPEGGAA
jgi:hypothetical protein